MSGHVAVAIVGFRNAADIALCLTALSAQDHDDFEVVICENGGPDAYAALSAVAPERLAGGREVRTLQAPANLGFAGGVNLCLNQTPDADAWWILNPDTEPAPGALSAMMARLASGDCDGVGCVLYRSDGRVQSYGGRWRSWMARAESLGIGRGLADPIDAKAVERRQNYLNGASMLIGRRFLETTGPMREDYFLYCEELEWCLRGRSLGMRLGFAPAARVMHRQGGATGAGAQYARRPRLPVYLDERNKILLTRDRFATRLPIAAPVALALLFLRCARAGGWRQWGYGLAGWRAGLLGERGPPKWLNP
jgi:GT2 family glycosyltransferase